MRLTPGVILSRLKQIFKLSYKDMVEIYALQGYRYDEKTIKSFLKAHHKDYESLGVFLDGLIAFKRGESLHRLDDDAEVVLSYNLMIKKLRIALELKEHEIAIVFALGDYELTKQQIKSLFRSEGHKNFKACSAECFEAFLDGLEEFTVDMPN